MRLLRFSVIHDLVAVVHRLVPGLEEEHQAHLPRGVELECLQKTTGAAQASSSHVSPMRQRLVLSILGSQHNAATAVGTERSGGAAGMPRGS